MRRFINVISIFIIVISAAACGRSDNPEIQTVNNQPVIPSYPVCTQAELISETIPDGTTFQAGEKFTKTWIIRNTSSCGWNDEYSLVYYDGIGMGESTHLLFTANMSEGAVISPGDAVTLTLNLRAPFAPGRQIGRWKLRDSAGILFMPDNVKKEALIVDIEVIGTVYSFVDNLCQATWKLNDQDVGCPFYSGSGNYELFVNSFPEFEGGNVENEPAINILLPETGISTLSGTFPALVIQKGDHLHLTTACADAIPQCDLTFGITALTESGSVTIGEWHEVSDGNMQSIELDISNMADRAVQFVFSLRSNGAIQGNRGLWFFPILLPY